MSKVVTKPIVLNTKESLDVRLPKHGKFFTKKSGKDLLVFEEGSDTPIAVYENYELEGNAIDLGSLPHYAELSTAITGVTTDAVIGSGAAATTSAAVAGTATAATGTGLSTMAMIGIGAVGVGGAAAIAVNNRSGGSSSVPVAPTTLPPVTDTTAPSLAITSAAITNSINPNISGTAEAGSVITLTIAGATYTATTAVDGTWSVDTAGIPSSGTFTLNPNGDNSVSVTATDAAGNVSVAATQTLLVDTTAPATAGFTFTDTGVSATDGLSSNPAITLTLANDTAAWQYSLDNGSTWVNGSGSSITLPEGTYDKQDVQVKQFDAAGNSSISHMSTTPTLAPLTMVQLEALGNTTGNDDAPQITAVGTAGEYVVTFYGADSAGDDSIFVQKFNADGTVQGAMVQLEALGNTTGNDRAPQITAVGTTGEYVVTFYGADSAGDDSIFVQKFNADGTVQGAMVQLEALGNTTGNDFTPQITAVGTTGEYVVTFQGQDSGLDYSIFVQKFNADGTVQGAMVQLEALGNTTGNDRAPQITAVGTTGEYVVTFYGNDGMDNSIFVQKFNADGTVQGDMVQLEALGNPLGNDYAPQITAVGTTGEYVVSFYGQNSGLDYSIFVQKFNADGTTTGNAMVQLETSGNTTSFEYPSQITAVGTTGEYVVTFEGRDSAGDYSIFVQKFNADGTTAGAMVQLEALGNATGNDYAPQITAVGTTGEYVVTFLGADANGDYSIFVQKFDANGAAIGTMSQINVPNASNDSNWDSQITAVGTAGEFAVTFAGIDSNGDASIFVQKFRADGTYTADMSNTMMIDTTAPSLAITSAAITNSTYPSISGTAEIGAAVTLVVAGATYSVTATNGTWSVNVGSTTPTGGTLTLDTNGDNSVSVTATDAAGNIASATQTLVIDTVAPAQIAPSAFVLSDTGVSASDGITADGLITITLASDTVTWQYSLSGGFMWTDGVGTSFALPSGSYDKANILVKQIDATNNASISTMVSMVQLEALGVTNGDDEAPQITAVGTTGEYVVTFCGTDSTGYYSIFVQKFNADGTVQGAMVQLEALGGNPAGYDYSPQITAVGTTGEYVVTFYGDDSTGARSIFVQKFNADGTVQGTMVQLEASGNTTGDDEAPQITAVGTTGEYVVTFYGRESAGDTSIFVQKFNADGTVQGTMVQLEALGTTAGGDYYPQITAVGTTGEYVVTFYGNDGTDYSIFVQKFNADGTVQGAMVQLEALGTTTGNEYDPQITSVGTAGEYVVTFYGQDSDGDNSIFVQKFNADGTLQGTMVQLEALGNSMGSDYAPQITAVGTTGEYVVTFLGADSAGDDSIFVQKFNADGTVQGAMVQLEALGNATGYDYSPQITAVETTGEYVVTFQGADSAGDDSIFVQKFNADGTVQGAMVQLEALGNTTGYDYSPQITAVGTTGEYVVTFYGADSAGDDSIFVQKFNADGTIVDIYNTIVVDTTAPTATMSALEYTITTDTLVITGLDMNTIAANGTDIKSVLDWSQLAWNIDGDTVAATTAETFASGDILSATVTSDTQLTIVFSNDKAIALEATTGFNTGATDTVDILAGFLRDTAGNVDMATYNTAVVYA